MSLPVPCYTWDHMVYLIDDKYLFISDTIWFGADGTNIRRLHSILWQL